MISILILTKNEEFDLPDCLASVSWCDDVHVLDSFSSDRTTEIAEEFGALLTQRKFDNYASQRNAGLNLKFKYSWIFILDADERIPQELYIEIIERLSNVQDGINGFRIKRRDFLNNKWLKYSQISSYYVRLVHVGKAHYHREINEVIQVDGAISYLDSYFNHFPFSKGYSHWLAKHNTYSTMEAHRWIEENNGSFRFSIRKAITSKDFSEKRYHQKGLFYKIPGRPFIKWIYMVVWRRAFLDGKPGIIYATLQAIYEYFIVLKTKEFLHKLNESEKKNK